MQKILSAKIGSSWPIKINSSHSTTFTTALPLSTTNQVWVRRKKVRCTGKSFSEALILATTNPQYDKILIYQFLHENYKVRTCCVHKLFWMPKQKTIYVHNMFWACSFHARTGKSMNNLLSYCGLVVARISASEKDLPVKLPFFGPNH